MLDKTNNYPSYKFQIFEIDEPITMNLRLKNQNKRRNKFSINNQNR